MVGSDTLLFPDTGVDFLNALKTSILYSRQTYSYTNVISPYGRDSEEAAQMDALMEQAKTLQFRHGPKRRFLEYATFVSEHNDDLKMLYSEGVLKYPGVEGHAAFQKVAPANWERMREVAERLVNNSDDPAVAPIFQAYECHIPCLMDFLGPEAGILSDPEWMPHWLFTLYLASLSILAERIGVGLMSWSLPFQNAVWAARKLLLTDDASVLRIGERRSLEARLGTAALARYLPAADDLPFEEILEIRQRYAAELEGFRTGIRELVTQIDPTKPPADVDLALHDLVTSKIDPAIRNLQSALYSARLDVLKKVGQSWNSLAQATVPFVLSFAAGAPLSVSGIVALLGPIAGAAIEAEVERRKLLHASQWSILLKLQNSR
jgi:hypothetical protein